MLESNQNNNSNQREQDLRDVRKFVFFKENKLDPHWVSDYAKLFAEQLAQQKMNITQIRAFYNEFLRVNEIASKADEAWIIIAKLIVAKAYYRANSSSAKIPKEFATFVEKLIAQVTNSSVRFSEACLVVESLVAYYSKPNFGRR